MGKLAAMDKLANKEAKMKCKCGHGYSEHTFTRTGWNETRRECDKCKCRFYIRR